MRRRLDGVLLLDKPAGPGSNAVLQSAKRLFAAEKAGHAGTLDPLASGLLMVLFGEATKFSQLGLDADKEYLAQARLGVTTTTADAEGEVLERRPCKVRLEDVEPVLRGFHGALDQLPPMYSALKHAGRPLYAIAREGRDVARVPRRIRVHALDLVALTGDRLDLQIRCSKGTYVRTLVEDIGRALGCGAHLAGLRRTGAGGFRVEDASTLEHLASRTAEERDARLFPVERLLEDLPRVDLDEGRAARFAQGQALRIEEAPLGPCRVHGGAGQLLGVGEGSTQGQLRPRRVLSNARG